MADRGGDVQCGAPGGGAGLVALVALLEGPNVFLLTSQCAFLPLRLHFTDEGSEVISIIFVILLSGYKVLVISK